MRIGRTLLVAAVAAACPLGGAAGDANTPLVVLPLRSNGLLAGVPLRVHREPLTFVLDTGAGTTVVDTAAERSLGLAVAGHQSTSGAGRGHVTSDRLRPLDITLGNGAAAVRFVSPEPLGIDLGHVGTTTREDGLLGFDFFRAFVVDVDYDRGVVKLYDPRTFAYRGTGTVLPVVIRHKHSYANVTVAARGVAAEHHAVMIDLGSEDAIDDDIVLRSTASAKRILGGSGIGQRFASTLGTVTTLRLGPYVLHDLPSATGGVQLIGSAVWRKFHVVYDLAHARIYLEPRKTTSQPRRKSS